MIHLCPDDADEPCGAACPEGDCAGCAFPPRRTSQAARITQQLAHERQKLRERAFAFEPQRYDLEAA
jgi:hypothetical protein